MAKRPKSFGKPDAQTGNKGKPPCPKQPGAGMSGVSNPGKLGTKPSIVKNSPAKYE